LAAGRGQVLGGLRDQRVGTGHATVQQILRVGQDGPDRGLQLRVDEVPHAFTLADPLTAGTVRRRWPGRAPAPGPRRAPGSPPRPASPRQRSSGPAPPVWRWPPPAPTATSSPRPAGTGTR